MRKSPSRDRRRQEEWREVTPELAHLVEEVAPRLWNDAQTDRQPAASGEWRTLIDALAARVHERAEASRGTLSIEQRRGYEWCWAMREVENALNYMMQLIRQDLSFKEGDETLASMNLVERAMASLHFELQDGGTEEGREDGEESTVRVYRALLALSPRFDDISLRRFRALALIERSAARIRIPDDAEVEASVEHMRACAVESGSIFDAEEEAKQRKWFRAKLPMIGALDARSMLADIDRAFATLDPLIVLEDLSEGGTGAKGGKADGGEAKTGPARALARLAIRCSGLEYQQAAEETFDEAVERVRKNLHTTRSRLREELRSFPGIRSEHTTKG